MAATTQSKRASKLPSIWGHKGERQFVSNIGWKRVSRGGENVRVCDFQWLERVVDFAPAGR
jgi:hypothetical protein